MIKKIMILMVLLIGTVFAQVEEIGVPYIEKGTGQIDSAVLAPDGKSFYTLKGGVLTQWGLSPLKKLKTWEFSLQKLKKHLHRDIYIDKSNSKVLIASKNEFMLFNVQTEKIEKRIAYDSHTRVQNGNIIYCARAIMDSTLFLDVWDIETLNKIQEINVTQILDKKVPDILRDEDKHLVFGTSTFFSDIWDELLDNENYLYYFSRNFTVLVFEKESLQLKEVVFPRENSFLTQDGYIVLGREVYRQSDGELVLVQPKDESKRLYSLLKTLNVTKVPRKDFFQRRTSQIGNLKLEYKNKSTPYAFYKALTNELIGYIFQDKDELLIINEQHYFESSSKHVVFLEMLDKKRKIVPINETTFEKYNKPLNIKAK